MALSHVAPCINIYNSHDTFQGHFPQVWFTGAKDDINKHITIKIIIYFHS